MRRFLHPLKNKSIAWLAAAFLRMSGGSPFGGPCCLTCAMKLPTTSRQSSPHSSIGSILFPRLLALLPEVAPTRPFVVALKSWTCLICLDKQRFGHLFDDLVGRCLTLLIVIFLFKPAPTIQGVRTVRILPGFSATQGTLVIMGRLWRGDSLFASLLQISKV